MAYSDTYSPFVLPIVLAGPLNLLTCITLSNIVIVVLLLLIFVKWRCQKCELGASAPFLWSSSLSSPALPHLIGVLCYHTSGKIFGNEGAHM